MTSLSFVFPCHNEERAIVSVLDSALKHKCIMEKDNSVCVEIIVVNDGSTDNSQNLLDTYKDEIKMISFPKRRGYGAALKAAFLEATGDWMAFCDLDATCDPRDLSHLLDLALQGDGVPVVCGLRLHKNSSMPYVRRIGNRLFAFVLWLLSFRYVPDPATGFRLFKKDRLGESVFRFPDDLSFAFGFTVYLIREKIPFRFLPISYHEREGQSKLHPIKDGLRFLKTLTNMLIFRKY